MQRATNRNRRRRLIAVGLVGSVAILGACTSDAAWQAPAGSTEEDGETGELGEPVAAADGSETSDVQLLFAMDADAASVTPAGQGYEVTLSEPSSVLVFTDRPARQADRVTTGSFAAAWDEMFADDPPNGALSGLTAEGATVDVPVELTAISEQGADLAFRLSVLPGVQVGPLPDQLRHVSLFIDDVATCGQTPASTCTIFASTFVPFDSSF